LARHTLNSGRFRPSQDCYSFSPPFHSYFHDIGSNHNKQPDDNIFLATNCAAAQQFDLREDERLGFPNDFWRELQVGLMFALTT
jgi:hypothetical protein